MTRMLDTLHAKVAALAEAIPEDKYSWRPASGVRSIGEVFMHVASEFEASITGSRPLFGGQRTIVETSFIMSSDLHDHLGQLIAYARMNGVKPSWSR